MFPYDISFFTNFLNPIIKILKCFSISYIIYKHNATFAVRRPRCLALSAVVGSPSVHELGCVQAMYCARTIDGVVAPAEAPDNGCGVIISDFRCVAPIHPISLSAAFTQSVCMYNASTKVVGRSLQSLEFVTCTSTFKIAMSSN